MGHLAFEFSRVKIDNYILERLRTDAAHTIAAAECETAIQHAGQRGRLREILVGNLLTPWLPPFCKCATGMIIEAKNKPRKSTQDDILVIDPMISPPMLANIDGPDGVFHLNSVLLRIEVKSKITQKGFRHFINASSEITKMEFSKQPGCKAKFTHPLSILVAFKSDCSNDDWDNELRRFWKAMKKMKCAKPLGFVSAICIIDKGFWFLGGPAGKRIACWYRFVTERQDDRLAYLVRKISDFAFRAHIERQGRDPSQSLEVGVGSFLPKGTIFPVSTDKA